MILLWAHAIALPVFGMLRGYGALHSVNESLALAALADLAMLAGRRKRIAAALVSPGLITSSALLVHLWGGVIEAHFHFFVMIVLLALYEDWFPFLLAATYVVIHHGLTGALDPASVYNHQDAISHPWRWAAIHGLFVTGAGIGAVATWRLNEDVRAETREAHRQARGSEERFRSAFEGAPLGMVLTTIDPRDPGRFIQVNPAMCEFTGRLRGGPDALLRALSERSPDLGVHLSDATELAAAAARRLGLPDEQLTPLLQAAALRDVGERKPGPVTSL